MAAVITSVVPVTGFYPEALVTINGTGFGGSPGLVYIVYPDLGEVVECFFNTWSSTSITSVSLEDEPIEDPSLTLPQTVFMVVLPLGETIGGRSASFQMVADSTPATVFPDGSIVVGRSGVEEDAPFAPLLGGGRVGFTGSFNNPDYTIYWYNAPDENNVFSGDAQSDELPANFAPIGPLSLRQLTTLGYTFSTTPPA
jgi:hypothetical protein